MCCYSCRLRFPNNCEVPRLPRGRGLVTLTGRSWDFVAVVGLDCTLFRFSNATLGFMQVTGGGYCYSFFPVSLERFKALPVLRKYGSRECCSLALTFF